MTSTTKKQPARHRPGGRTARTTERIHAAVIDLLVSEGHAACTLGRIADLTGLQRSTLYRRYADRWEMIIQAYQAKASKEVDVEPTGDFLGDFRTVLTRFVENFSGPLGHAMMSVVFAVRGTPEEKYVDRFMDVRLVEFEPIFEAAIKAGSIDPATESREVIERAAGAAIFRLFVEGLPVDQDWIDRMIAALDRLYSPAAKETAS